MKQQEAPEKEQEIEDPAEHSGQNKNEPEEEVPESDLLNALFSEAEEAAGRMMDYTVKEINTVIDAFFRYL